MDVLEDLINKFNTSINTATGQFAITPSEYNGTVYANIVKINEYLISIGMIFLFAYFTYDLYCKFIDFKFKDYKIYISSFAKLAIGIAILENNLYILEMIMFIANQILDAITGLGDVEMTVNIDRLKEDYENLSTFGKLDAKGMILITSVILLLDNFIIIWVVLARMIELFIYIAFAPLAMSSFTSEKTSGIGKEYILNIFSVCLKASVVVLALQIYKWTVVGAGTGEYTNLNSYLHNLALSGIILLTLIIGAEKISKTIVGHIR